MPDRGAPAAQCAPIRKRLLRFGLTPALTGVDPHRRKFVVSRASGEICHFTAHDKVKICLGLPCCTPRGSMVGSPATLSTHRRVQAGCCSSLQEAS
jgi:hypothetical protein